jgi:hypothetical protein
MQYIEGQVVELTRGCWQASRFGYSERVTFFSRGSALLGVSEFPSFASIRKSSCFLRGGDVSPWFFQSQLIWLDTLF